MISWSNAGLIAEDTSAEIVQRPTTNADIKLVGLVLRSTQIEILTANMFEGLYPFLLV